MMSTPPRPMHFYFRIEASHGIGAGHLFRCYAIAEALRIRSAQVTFITTAETAALFPDICSAFPNVFIPPSLPEADDAAFTGRLLEERTSGLVAVIVDHYRLSCPWENVVSQRCTLIAAVDDLGRRHCVDVLIDHNMSTSTDRYPDSQTGRMLLGSTYAMLRPEVAAGASRMKPYESRPNRLFLCFGGSDPEQMTERSLPAVERSVPKDWEIIAVIGAGYRDAERLISKAQRAQVLTQPKDFVALLANSRFAVGAGGIMHYERCALGVPSITITIAENQEPGTEALAAAGGTAWLARSSEFSEAALAAELSRSLSNSEQLGVVSKRCLELVDGRGAERIAVALLDALASR